MVDRQDAITSPDVPNIKHHITFTKLCKQTAYFNLAGQFPHQLMQENNYIMVTYNYNTSYILIQVIQNREAATITKAWLKSHKQLAKVAGRLKTMY